jgi:hypothetical protein
MIELAALSREIVDQIAETGAALDLGQRRPDEL